MSKKQARAAGPCHPHPPIHPPNCRTRSTEKQKSYQDLRKLRTEPKKWRRRQHQHSGPAPNDARNGTGNHGTHRHPDWCFSWRPFWGGVIARNGAPRANPFDSNGTGFVRPALHAAQIAPAETSSKAVVSLIVKETGAPGTTLEDHENKQPIVIGFARHKTRICARAAAQRCQERYHRLL